MPVFFLQLPVLHVTRGEPMTGGAFVSTCGVPAAVHKQGVAADEIRGGAGQKERCANQIGGLREAPQFNPAPQPFRAGWIFLKRETRTVG